MKITIDERPEASGIEVAIVCRKTDQQVLDIVARLRMFDRKVTGSADGGTHVVNAEDILYVESVDKRTFFYTEGAVFETRPRCGSTRWRSAWRDATSCGWPRAAW